MYMYIHKDGNSIVVKLTASTHTHRLLKRVYLNYQWILSSNMEPCRFYNAIHMVHIYKILQVNAISNLCSKFV